MTIPFGLYDRESNDEPPVVPRERSALLLILILALGACDSSTAPVVSDLTGEWEGSLATQASMVLDISEVDGTVIGTADFVGTGGSAQVTRFNVSGTFNDPNIALTLTSDAWFPLDFSGRLASVGSIEATVDGEGYDNREVVLFRQ